MGSIPTTRSISLERVGKGWRRSKRQQGEGSDREQVVCNESVVLRAHIAQSVEHFLGKEEVTGSIPVMGSMKFAERCEPTPATSFS